MSQEYSKSPTKDIVRAILKEHPDSRSDDRILIWRVWQKQGFVTTEVVHAHDFLKYAAHPESITRCRRKLQEADRERLSKGTLNLDLSVLPTKEVAKLRAEREATKGSFVETDQISMF